MSLLYDKVVHIVSKPPTKRTESEVEKILPWFRKRSELFKSQKTEIVHDIIKNCQFMTCKRDHVIIKQGDKGDCFYIILSGSVAIYIHTHLEEGGINYTEPSNEFNLSGKPKELDRTPFGNYVGTIPAGKSFGELALINTDCVRNASIIADETTDLLIVNRELYSRSLKAFQEKEFNEKKMFVEEFPLFKGWQTRYKKQLAMSLRKEKVNFDGIVVKQGCPVDGLCFLLSGQAKMLVDPVVHEIQYPDLFPLPDIHELEKVEARESIRREMNMASLKVEEKKLNYRPKSPNPERKLRTHRNVEVCTIGAVEVLGDLEMTMGLNSYAESAQCTQVAEMFILDQKNYERLIERRNPQALDALRDDLHEKLKLRLSWIQEDEIPLFKYYLYKLDERKRHENDKYRESRRKANMFDWKAMLNKGPLIDQFGPGSIFYRIRMREKSRRPQAQASTAGARGFGITRHLLLGRNHGAAYLSRKPVYSTDQNLYTPEPQTVANNSENSDSDDANDEIQSDIDVIDIEMVDSRKPSRKSARNDKVHILCENAYENAKANAKAQKAKREKAVDDFKSTELSEFNLQRLETKIEEWHSKVDQIDENAKPSRKHLVKLHRYNAEENKKPMPGKKIILKPKAKPKNNLLTLHFDALRKSTLSSQSFLASPGLNNGAESDQMETAALAEQSQRQKRPLSCKNRPDITPSVTLKTRPKSAHQYTIEEYGCLKEQLRRKQIAYKSILARTATTCF